MATVTLYYMRARDSGTSGWVYWTANDPTLTPLASTTNPNYTGALSVFQIVFSYQSFQNTGFGGLVFQGYTTVTPFISGSRGDLPGWVNYGSDNVSVSNVSIKMKNMVFNSFVPANTITDVLVFSGTNLQVT